MERKTNVRRARELLLLLLVFLYKTKDDGVVDG